MSDMVPRAELDAARKLSTELVKAAEAMEQNYKGVIIRQRAEIAGLHERIQHLNGGLS